MSGSTQNLLTGKQCNGVKEDNFLDKYVKEMIKLEENGSDMDIIQFRRRFFSRTKKVQGSSLEPLLDNMFAYLISDYSLAFKSVVVEQLIDIHDVIRKSISNGWTNLDSKAEQYIRCVDSVYVNSKLLSLKIKVITLKLVINDILSSCDGAFIIKSDTDSVSERILKMVKKDSNVHVMTVVYKNSDNAFAILDEEMKELLLYDNSGIIMEIKVMDLYLLKRKYFYYFCYEGKNHSVE